MLGISCRTQQLLTFANFNGHYNEYSAQCLSTTHFGTELVITIADKLVNLI